jgi:hypothetical protein
MAFWKEAHWKAGVHTSPKHSPVNQPEHIEKVQSGPGLFAIAGECVTVRHADKNTPQLARLWDPQRRAGVCNDR